MVNFSIERSRIVDMEFRTAQLEDLPAIAELFHACWHRSYAELLSEEVRTAMTLASAADLWRPALVEPLDRETIVGVEADRIVSVFRIGKDKDDSNRGHLFSLYVAPDNAGKGIGTATLTEAVERVSARGFPAISLWVFAANDRAKGLYGRAGFVASGRTRRDDRWRELEIEMVKPLTKLS